MRKKAVRKRFKNKHSEAKIDALSNPNVYKSFAITSNTP